MIKMNQPIPFYKNRGYRCAQTVMKSVVGSLYPDRKLSFRELDAATLRSGREWTLLPQIANGFIDIGIDFEYFVKDGCLQRCLDGHLEEDVRNYYGPHAEKVLGVINRESVKRAAEAVLKSGKISTDKPVLELLEKRCQNGDLDICVTDNSVLDGHERCYKAHVVVLTWVGEKNVYYHDCGPVQATPNKKVSRERFVKAWEDICWMDYGTIIVPRSQVRDGRQVNI